MLISELVRELKEIKHTFGDIEVVQGTADPIRDSVARTCATRVRKLFDGDKVGRPQRVPRLWRRGDPEGAMGDPVVHVGK